ncbi:hypothetical protein MTP99_011799 [Tenebrio molitor]|nr:hypothetical protein MTP99_011799 [Tenebrio molitor]
MSTSENMRSISSLGQLSRTSSHRQPSKRMKSSFSSASMMKRSSVTPPDELSVRSTKTDVSKAEKKSSEGPGECECGPDLYSRVLGPTADETILTGLQTVIDLCSRLRVCGDKDDAEDEEPEREPLQDIPERDPSQEVKSSKSQTERSMLSAGFQVNPSVKSVAAQTAPFPEVVSKILQTVGLTPELVSKVMQTSFVDLGPPKASVTSIYMQTSNATLKSNAMQTSETNIENSETQSDNIRTISRQTMSDNSSLRPSSRQYSEVNAYQSTVYKVEEASKGDEHKCISPPEPGEGTTKTCKCCSSSSTSPKESKESTDKPPCVCGSKRKVRCECVAPGPRRSRTGVEGDQQPPLEVKYAVTKISKYKEFTTFEVMKSTKNKPKQMPKNLEGVFVLRKKKDGSKGEVKSSSETKNEVRSHSKMEKIESRA